MHDLSPNSTPPSPSADVFAAAVAAAGQRIQHFLSAQRQRMAGIEAQLAEQIGRLHASLGQHQAELDTRQNALEAAEGELRRRQRSTMLAGHEQEADLEHLQELRRRLDQRAAELDARQEKLAAAEARTATQRRHIADELQARRNALLNVFQRHEDELATGQREFVEPREISLASPRQSWSASAEATEEIRQLRAENAQLMRRIAELRTASFAVSAPAPEPLGMTWEAQKQRLLTALENESKGGMIDEPRAAERLQIEDIIRATDERLRAKDREIEEMRVLLAEQSTKVGELAVGAAALGDVLDSDPLIREQREHLQKMQEHWEEMLRQAEIDLSTERATLARERAEVNERIRAFEQNHPPQENEETARQTADKPAHSRWLARLGLVDPH